MKSLTGLVMATLFFAANATAQFSQNFDQPVSGLSSNCWTINQVEHTTTSADVINGTGSAYTNPPTSSSGERSISTPFLNVTSTTLTVSFKYKTSNKISGNATRTLNIGLVDGNGVFTSLQVITMDKNSPTTVQTLSATYNLSSTGVYRFQIRVGGATGDGNSRIILDDLNISASAYYGPTNHCNPAGIAVNDTYNAGSISAVSGNVITNDQIPGDGEIYAAVLVTPPASGTLVVNSNGTFTFTPGETFTGGPVTFTYQLVDNGYAPATSNIATVTINYPAPMLLPVILRNFSATLKNAAVEISWVVDNSFEGEY